MNTPPGTGSEGPGSLQRMVRPLSRTQKLCSAAAILSDVLRLRERRAGSTFLADRLHARVRLTNRESNALAALANKTELELVHRATTTKCFLQLLLLWVDKIAHRCVKRPNDPSSATRPTRAFDCNRNAMAGFAAAPG